MNDDPPPLLVYMDHNFLESVLEGDPDQVNKFLKGNGCLPVYSDENLKEISKSTGFEDRFLDLLEELEAFYLEKVLDASFVPTGQARISKTEPHRAYQQLMETLETAPKIDGELTQLLMKVYGGKADASYREMMSKGSAEVGELVRSAVDTLESDATANPQMLAVLRQIAKQIPDILSEATSPFADQMDAHCPDSATKMFQEEAGIDPQIGRAHV